MIYNFMAMSLLTPICIFVFGVILFSIIEKIKIE